VPRVVFAVVGSLAALLYSVPGAAAARATVGNGEVGTMPTRATTGPESPPTKTMTAKQFLAGRQCDGARIVGDIHVDDPSPEQSRFTGKSLSMHNCVVKGQFYWSISGSATESQYPTFTITNTDFLGSVVIFSPLHLTMERTYVHRGGWWAPCNDCTGPNWDLRIPMPIDVRDSYFRHPAVRPTGAHTEAIMVMGSGVGYRFTNVRFTQLGPYNGSQTGAINFSGEDSRFENVWFDFGDTETASYFTVYIDGPGNVVEGCAIQRGLASYIYPDSEELARYVGCVDAGSGSPLELP
jgi:hypothetical protein